jgi:Ca2+-transporting ATPase
MTAAPAAGVRPTGLTAAEAARLLDRCGPNTVVVHRRVPVWTRAARQFRDPMLVVLLGATALTLLTADYTDALIIGLVIVANSTVGVVQEVRADAAIAALADLAAPTARVRRDGVVVDVPATTIVPGDVVTLGEGDVVPADGEVLLAVALLVDESALTGESVPVEKDPPASTYAGTVVVHGRGEVAVTATGADSALGRTAAMLADAYTATPLQRRLAGLSRTLATAAGVLCLTVMTLGLLRGEPVELMVVTAVSLAVAAVPESLPAVVTLALAMGARRMAQRHAIVRRLPAVESLGSVTLLATDKTGTLTEGRMAVERAWMPTGEVVVRGVGYEPTGSLHDVDGQPCAPSRELRELLLATALCNDAQIAAPDEKSPEWRSVGDPTEAALLAAASRAGVDASALAADYPRLAESPFDSVRRRMTTVHGRPEGGHLVVTKGAPAAVLDPAVTTVDDDVRRLATTRAADLAADGYRVLAVASRVAAAASGDPAVESHGLRLLGLVAIADPVRANAGQTIAAFVDAGIAPVLVTGDHPGTANAVAGRVGIAPDRVHARMTPADKLELIRAWQADGHIVAMTGDGVNDGPALRKADIGVAMGRRGTEVARQSADLVLADDNLTTLVHAIEEGRRVYANVRRFLLYGLSGGLAEIAIMLVGPVVGLGLPLLPAQILWVNLLTHGLPGVALGAEPAEPGVLRRPPRRPDEPLLGGRLWLGIVGLSTVLTVLALGVGVWAERSGRPWQSLVFLVLAVTQLGVALGVRARRGPRGNPSLLGAVLIAAGLGVAGVFVPALRDLLGTEALTAAQVLLVVACGAVGYVGARAVGDRSLR